MKKKNTNINSDMNDMTNTIESTSTIQSTITPKQIIQTRFASVLKNLEDYAQYSHSKLARMLPNDIMAFMELFFDKEGDYLANQCRRYYDIDMEELVTTACDVLMDKYLHGSINGIAQHKEPKAYVRKTIKTSVGDALMQISGKKMRKASPTDVKMGYDSVEEQETVVVQVMVKPTIVTIDEEEFDWLENHHSYNPWDSIDAKLDYEMLELHLDSLSKTVLRRRMEGFNSEEIAREISMMTGKVQTANYVNVLTFRANQRMKMLIAHDRMMAA